MQPLSTGTYTLKVRTPIDPTLNNPTGTPGITDLVGNKLNADAANPTIRLYDYLLAERRHRQHAPKYGTEVLVDQTTDGIQTTTSTGLNVAGDAAVTRNVASDDKGDFVAVWLQYDSDGYTDVYMRLYNNTGNPLTNETLVNTYTLRSQTKRRWPWTRTAISSSSGPAKARTPTAVGASTASGSIRWG